MLRTALSTALFLTLATNLPGCAASPDEPEGTEVATGDAEEPGNLKQAVQLSAGTHFGLDMTDQSQVEGFLMYLGGNGTYWVLCGVTFVSRHFGITAGHCVTERRVDTDNTFNPGDQAFIVAQLDARNIIAANGGAGAALTKIIAQGQVTGTWQQGWRRGPSLGCSDGLCLSMVDTQCRVRLRCGGQQPPEVSRNDGCPLNIAGHDIALVHCPNRPTTMPFATVVAGDVVNGQDIDIHWYHELLNLPSSEGQGTQDQRDHYMRYDGSNNGVFGKVNNYHYVGGAQYFPLLSTNFPSGEHYKVTDTSVASMGSISTNAYGCHGTSGSGTFLANTTQLIGPVFGGGSSGFLCMDPVAHVPRDPSTGNTLNWQITTSPWVTRTLENLVLVDR